MENYIIFFIVNIAIDMGLLFSMKTIFKLSIKKINLLFLEIFNVINMVIYKYFEIKFYQFILIKLAICLIIILLITDTYKFKNLTMQYMTILILMFSYFGFFKFVSVLISSIFNNVFCKNLSHYGQICIVFVVVLYIFAVFICVSKLSKIKKIKSLLRKVSFFAFGKHIEIMGLLDTGNVLYDTKTGLPVIIINVKSLGRFLSQKDYKNITNEKYFNLGVHHYLKVKTISNEDKEIPIIIPKSVVIKNGGLSKNEKCVLGLVNHDFENSKDYQCLLHRDLF